MCPTSEMERPCSGEGAFWPKITENPRGSSLFLFFTSQHWRRVRGPRRQGRCRRYHFFLGEYLRQDSGLSPVAVTPGPGAVGWWEVSLQVPRPPAHPPPAPQCPRLGSPLSGALGRARAAWGHPGWGPGRQGNAVGALRAKHLQERPQPTLVTSALPSAPHFQVLITIHQPYHTCPRGHQDCQMGIKGWGLGYFFCGQNPQCPEQGLAQSKELRGESVSERVKE